ncbi:MAG: DNA-processing protein DprA [Candidatus Marinimicrobia bacterium]|nr:DNA-processing protein DprA [Candidatus Neomarinimicrobiota bacterium]
MGHVETALKLVSIKGMGCRKILKLSAQFSDINEIFETIPTELYHQKRIDAQQKKDLETGYDPKIIDDILAVLSKSHFKILTIFDDDYPELLKKIYDPPIVLYLNGDLVPEDYDAISVVGTRQPSAYGKNVTEKIVRELCENNIAIISGMARGVDTEAHRAALKYGGRTIAVLGNGIDIVYPAENRNLRNQIIQQGCCCSEFPFGTPPNAPNFPRRNRIISGLSLGTIVVEAGRKSGAVLTAYNALDQNREVFAVPGRIFDKKSEGTNHLIQKGAKMVTDIDSILEEIDVRRRYYRREKQVELPLDISQVERKILDILNGSVHVDDIAEKGDMNISEVLSTLLTLEIKGLVRQFPGKMFAKMEY